MRIRSSRGPLVLVVVLLFAVVAVSCGQEEDPPEENAVPVELVAAEAVIDEEVLPAEWDPEEPGATGFSYQAAFAAEQPRLFDECSSTQDDEADFAEMSEVWAAPGEPEAGRVLNMVWGYDDADAAEELFRVLTPAPLAGCFSDRTLGALRDALEGLEGEFEDRGVKIPATQVVSAELVADPEPLSDLGLDEADLFEMSIALESDLAAPAVIVVDYALLWDDRVVSAVFFSEVDAADREAVLAALATVIESATPQ